MPGVHRLQHVERFATAAFADDDAIGAHAKRVSHQIADGHRTPPLEVRRPRLQRDQMAMIELQFGGVLDGDDALAGRDEIRQHVQAGGLARSGATGDDDVAALLDADAQELGHAGGQGAEIEHVGHLQVTPREFSDGECRTFQRQRCDDCVDP